MPRWPGGSSRKELIEKIIALWKENCSASEIAKALGVTRGAVSGIVRDYRRKFGDVEHARRPGFDLKDRPRTTRTKVVHEFSRSDARPKPKEYVERYIAPRRSERGPVREKTKEEMRREIEEAMVRTAKMQEGR